jgi:hypothetical protein
MELKPTPKMRDRIAVINCLAAVFLSLRICP